MKIKVVLFKSSKNRQWYFRLVARNGRTLLQSEGYTRKSSANQSIRSVVHGINPALKWRDYAPKP